MRCATWRAPASTASIATRMAVELTKVALWIETVEPGKPLGFLDANIRCGDSLLGVFDLEALRHGIPDAAYKPLTGDDKETAKHFEQRNKAERAGQGDLDFARGGGRLPAAAPLAAAARAACARCPKTAPRRSRRSAGASQPAEPTRAAGHLRIAADLYIAAFLTPKTGGVPANRNTVTIPTTAHVWDALAGRTVYGPLVGRAQDLAGAGARLPLAARISRRDGGGRFRRRARQSAVGADQAAGAGILRHPRSGNCGSAERGGARPADRQA